MVIDEVTRAYERNEDWKELKKEHLDLVSRSAKTVYLILKNLREQKAVETKLIEDTFELVSLRQQMSEIPAKVVQSQSEVDNMLSAMIDKKD